ncbi:hypothetical protein GCM10022383_13870 [Microbacterium soli]|uniref:SsuA/THI5-like domain-containing protein n=1 Tax=Microbacterium soli TaxID=446075 RepID=A0ABP7N6T2_9MICO
MKVGLTPFQDFYVVLIGIEKGYWAEEGIKLDIVNLSYESVTESLASGSVEIGTNNDAFVLGGQDKYPEQVQSNIFFLFQGGAIMVRPDGPFTTYDQAIAAGATPEEARRDVCAQLRDKTILLTTNSDFELTVAAAAQSGGLDYFNDVKFIDGNPDENLAAFMGGAGDGYIGGLPQRTRLVEEGMVPLITAENLSSEATIQGGWSASEKLIAEEPEVFMSFQRVIYRCLQFIEENPEEGFQIIIDKLSSETGANYTHEDLESVWNKVELFPASGEQMEAMVFDESSQFYWRPRYEFVEKFYLERGVVSGPVDLDRIFPFQWIHAQYMAKYESDAWESMGAQHASGDLVESR